MRRVLLAEHSTPLPGTRPPLRDRAGVALGLLFLAWPLSDLIQASLAPAQLAAILLGLAAFVFLYVSILPPSAWLTRLGPNAMLVAIALLPVIATVLLLIGAPASFAALYVYFVAVVGMQLALRPSLALIGVTALALATGMYVYGASQSAIASTTLTVVAIGLMMTAFGRIARANRELRRAREELARLAVADERLRIARDLHDLLGHSLSVVTLKSQLARRVLEDDPARAARELDDIHTVSREALAEVREAVQGYRRLALDDALLGARRALAAAGIDCELAESVASLPPEVESVLAWAVREGTTNVIRHSDARSCAIHVHADADRAAVEIEDDGTGAAWSERNGSGLAGLRERAQRLRGELDAGTSPTGGFRLRLSVPLAAP